MSHIIVDFLNELRHTQFQPRAWMIDYQRRLLEPLVRHARAHVPFYRDSGRLDPLFRKDGSIDWERWGEIPLLTRRDLQQNFEALQAEFLPPEHGRTFTFSTSGTTGEPVKIVHTALGCRIAWTAQLLRDLERYRIDPTRRVAFLRPPSAKSVKTKDAKPQTAWFPTFRELGLLGERFDLADTLPSGELVEAVIRVRPEYMHVQPIALELMCAHDREGRLGELNIDAIFTVGDQFSPEAKRDVSLHLGCRIMDHYASQECGRLATSCPGCGQFHVDSEVNLVEVIGDQGAPTPEGEIGWIIVTPFYNYAMPLIRYDHADQAKVGAPDACVIKLPALEAIYGKEREPFRFPDGTVIRPTLSSEIVIQYLGAQAYQFAQVAPDRCEVRIVRGSIAPEEMQFDALTQHLRSIWWKGLQVNYCVVEAIPRPSPRAKMSLFVNEACSDNMN